MQSIKNILIDIIGAILIMSMVPGFISFCLTIINLTR